MPVERLVILRCPNPKCGGACDTSGFGPVGPNGEEEGRGWTITVMCSAGCGYSGPSASTDAEAIALHNGISEMRDQIEELQDQAEQDRLRIFDLSEEVGL